VFFGKPDFLILKSIGKPDRIDSIFIGKPDFLIVKSIGKPGKEKNKCK
jgi:hypothetical protein